jgi:hypothetical protein
VRFLLAAVWLCVGFAALVGAAFAASAATPVAPEPGAVTSSHPVFAWTLSAGEESDTVHIASAPETTPEGEFHSENLVMTGAMVESASTTWSPREALFAGRYWWNVETRDADFARAFSAVREFSVAPEVRPLSVRFSRSTYLRQVAADLRWVTNVREVAIEVRFLRSNRLVGQVRGRAETLVSREPDRALLQWRAPRKVRPGARLVAVVRLIAASHSAVVHRSFRAP